MPGYYFLYSKSNFKEKESLKMICNKFYLINLNSIFRLLLTAVIIFAFSGNSFSQFERITEKHQPLKIQISNTKNPKILKDNKKKPVSGKQQVALQRKNDSFSQTPANNFTQREIEIMNDMDKLKQDENSVNGSKIIDLQKELETINGSTVTRQETSPIGTVIPASKFSPGQTDNLSHEYVLFNAGNYVAGIATQVEQRGPTAGKIWVAIGLANGDTGIFAIPDSIAVYYSVNNGATYNLYAVIAFSSHNKIEWDNMDMEIIENTSGQKYLHIVFGYVTNGGYGQRLIGYTIVSAPALGYAGSTLFFPGYNSSSYYKMPRITSDNARYSSNPYITIVVTQDSIANNEHYFMSKVCRVLSPYTVTPSVSYLPKSIYGVAPGHNYEVFTDVANFHNGNDSLIFVLSGYPGGYEPYIYLYKGFSNSVVYPVFSGILTPTGDNLEYARVASSAGTNQTSMMITYTDNYFNSGDLDQWILYTYDVANWYSNTIDYTSYNNSRFGDIISRRNANGSFAIAFKNIYGSLENVSSCTFTDDVLSSYIHSLNTDYANSLSSPKPAFKYQNGDSCLTIWNYFYAVSSTGGCSASNLYLTAALEGPYDEVNDIYNGNPALYVLLAETSPPYNIVDTGYVYLDYQRLSNVVTFPRSPAGDYYLVVKHYNSLETWSSVPVSINTTTPAFYDFTTSDAQAYGNNMKLKGTRWCIYTGDVDRNNVVDLSDVLLIYNDGVNFVFGDILPSDLNNDGYVDLNDVLLAYNNSINFIATIRP